MHSEVDLKRGEGAAPEHGGEGERGESSAEVGKSVRRWS